MITSKNVPAPTLKDQDQHVATIKGITMGVKTKQGKFGEFHIHEGAFKLLTPSGELILSDVAATLPNDILPSISGEVFTIDIWSMLSARSPTGRTLVSKPRVTQEIWDMLDK